MKSKGMEALEELGRGSEQFTVILWNAKKMSLMFYPRAQDINEAIRKSIAYQKNDGHGSWHPLFAWKGRVEPDYSYYDQEHLDYLLNGESEVTDDNSNEKKQIQNNYRERFNEDLARLLGCPVNEIPVSVCHKIALDYLGLKGPRTINEWVSRGSHGIRTILIGRKTEVMSDWLVEMKIRGVRGL